MSPPLRKKSASALTLVTLEHNDLIKLNRIYSLQLLSEEKTLNVSSSCSLGTNKVIDDIVKNYDCNEIKLNLYKKRWFLLILIILSLTVSSFQWLQFCIVSNVIELYYQTSTDVINLTSLIFMLIYCLMFIPIICYCEKHSLRHIAIIGSVGTSIAAWIKIFSVENQNFLYVLIGQVFCAVFQIFLSYLPSKLAEVWFPKQEISLISGFSLFSSQLGMAANFFLTPLIVSDNSTNVKSDLEILLIGTAVICTLVSLIIIATFESKPQLPPSQFRALKLDHVIEETGKNVLKSMKILLLNRNFAILAVGYGLNMGIFNAFTTLLNSIVLHYFPKSQSDAGIIGLSLILMGLVGSLIFASILDKFNNHKTAAIWNLRLQTIAIILFSLALESRSKVLMYIASVLLGFFMTGFQLIGQEYGVELTFGSVHDGYVVGVLNICGYFFGIFITLLIKELQESFTILYGNFCFSLLLMVGIIFISLTTPELRRQKTNLFIEEAAAMEFEFSERDDDTSRVFIEYSSSPESGIESDNDDDDDDDDDECDDDFLTMRQN